MQSDDLRKSEEGESLLTTTDRPLVLTEQKHGWRDWRLWAMVGCAVAMGLVAGYAVGRGSHPKDSHYGLPLPPGKIETQWHHNLTFTQKPDPQSENAWASIIPVGRGFVHQEPLAPYVSNIAVFHQLHCLHAIVIAYYKALESPAIDNLTAIQEFDGKTGTRTAIFHIRHCFDYIRQALMCHADTNLEVLNSTTHATNGWNQPKTCRDYSSIVKWAERYANSTDTGIVT